MLSVIPMAIVVRSAELSAWKQKIPHAKRCPKARSGFGVQKLCASRHILSRPGGIEISAKMSAKPGKKNLHKKAEIILGVSTAGWLSCEDATQQFPIVDLLKIIC